ncbi:MAG: hypothetical protein AAFZ52_05380 [Bacteroidota bacterium]
MLSGAAAGAGLKLDLGGLPAAVYQLVVADGKQYQEVVRIARQ